MSDALRSIRVLSDVQAGSSCIVTEIRCGLRVRQRLANLGVFLGVEVTVESKSGFGGGLLLNIEGQRVGVGRTVAAKILVEPCK